LLILITSLFGRKKKPTWPPEGPISEVPDEALMAMYAKGTAEAFEVLLTRHERGVFNFILRSTNNRARAEDLTQDVFFRVIRSAPKYKTSARFTTWLYTIARNICIDQSRRKATKLEVSIDKPMGRGDGDGKGRSLLDGVVAPRARSGGVEVVKQEFRDRLKRALDELPEEQREVFVLREVSGMKFREIADVVGVPENTVKSRMRYALETLRGHLEEFRGYSFDKDTATDVGGA
jgi:RNA polymerase sigma-70 factor, ECF subfamily